jgi:site-specific DNA-methyltransferase (adenine-specific)
MVIHADNMDVLPQLPDAQFRLIYLDPPFNTGRTQARQTITTRRTTDPRSGEGPRSGEPHDRRSDPRSGESSGPLSASRPGSRIGFKGQSYDTVKGTLTSYDDTFADYWAFLEPRLEQAWRLLTDDGTLYLHLDFREVHYAKVLLDALFGRESFLNEIIWAYDYGARTTRKWPAKHDTILVYVKDPRNYIFNADAVDREPYMAPGLVTPEKAARGKLPTDVWWHTIVSPTGHEKTGYATQKPEGILRRIVAASSNEGDWVLDFFAGSGTTGAVAASLGRRFLLVDQNPEAVAVMRNRLTKAQTTFVDSAASRRMTG